MITSAQWRSKGIDWRTLLKKECDISMGSKHTLTPPTYFQGGQDLQPQDLRPWLPQTDRASAFMVDPVKTYI